MKISVTHKSRRFRRPRRARLSSRPHHYSILFEAAKKVNLPRAHATTYRTSKLRGPSSRTGSVECTNRRRGGRRSSHQSGTSHRTSVSHDTTMLIATRVHPRRRPTHGSHRNCRKSPICSTSIRLLTCPKITA